MVEGKTPKLHTILIRDENGTYIRVRVSILVFKYIDELEKYIQLPSMSNLRSRYPRLFK